MTEAKVNYSIIIPHKNIPVLLQRCLDSIPRRDDVQVIVVDDNSSPEVVEFGLFPGLERDDVEVVFTKEGKGAGFARNVGLDHAKGKWLIFLDSDDFLSANADRILTDTINSSYDIIFYDNRTVMSDDISQESGRDSLYHQYIQGYLRGDIKEEVLRYDFQPLWGKIIRHSIVQDNHIRFGEVGWSNDVFFSCCTGYHAKSIGVVDDVLYIVTQRSGSLTSNFCGTNTEFRVRLQEAIRSESFLAARGIHPEILQSKKLLRFYYRNRGKKCYLSELIFHGLLSKKGFYMFKYLISVFKERID